MAWFGGWLEGVKTIIRFLRVRSYRSELRRVADLHDLNSLVLANVPPGFAAWRWATLKLICSYLGPCFGLFEAVWTRELFRSCQSRLLEGRARSSATSDVYYRRFCSVSDQVGEVHKIRTWSTGCPCHEAERLRGETVRCQKQGKRLEELPGRLDEFHARCAACAEGPVAGQLTAELDLDFAELEAWSAQWRFLSTLARTNFAFIYTQPYTLARIYTVADLQRELGIWQATPKNRRHRVSNYFFDKQPGKRFMRNLMF
jgi:hypothetical protein